MSPNPETCQRPAPVQIIPRTSSFTSEAEVAVSVLRSAIDAVIVIDHRGMIRYCNPAVLTLFGHDPESLRGKNVSVLMPEAIASRHDGYIDRYLRSGRASIIGKGREVMARARDGRIFPAELSVTKTSIENETHFVGVIRDISDRQELEEEAAHSIQVISCINKILDKFIGANRWNKRELFDEALSNILSLTDSDYGFIGEILRTNEGVPYLKTQAITNIAWDAQTRKLYKDNARNGLEFYNLNTLFGVTIRSGDMVISNEPQSDRRAGGLPSGHPPLNTYLGLPIYAGSRFVGMAGLANRKDGYDEDLVDLLRPFVNTLGSVIVGFQNLEQKHHIELDLYHAQQKLREMASYDHLTGILNRHAFIERAENRLAEARGQQSSVSMLFVDIDRFKTINDSLGHLIGDQTLTRVVETLSAGLRATDFIGRYGGEEFLVLSGGSDVVDGFALGERLRTAVAEIGDSNGAPLITVSVGVASTSQEDFAEGATLTKLIEMADAACYVAKAEGRNCTRVFDQDAMPAAAD